MKMRGRTCYMPEGYEKSLQNFKMKRERKSHMGDGDVH
jgi:hypothetical protein